MTKKQYLKSKIDSLNEDQKILFEQMLKSDLLQVCIPTGAGKGYLMMVDLLKQALDPKQSIFAIASHRLMLNTQHLNDVFNVLSPLLGKVGYIFVGSSKYDTSKFQDNTEFNKQLLKMRISYDEIVNSTTSMKEVEEMTQRHLDAGRKVVVITTYHSLHVVKNLEIDTIYFDEAHTLANEDDAAKFKENYNQISFNRGIFLTATPKDCTEETGSFLMNNEEVFGRRIGLTFKECVDKGYIVRPIVHIAMPSNFDPTLEFKSVPNLVRFIQETFSAHENFIKEHSSDPSKIAPKVLFKCSSVDDMWNIHTELVGKMEGVRVCAGASRSSETSNFYHIIDDEGIMDRSEYLEKIQNFRDDEKAIVLHYDTMSEGINVAGFTGVEFLSGTIPTKAKTLQNTGRSTRLHKDDRIRVVNGEISTKDYSKWIKPYCSVILPFWDNESQFTTRELAKSIKDLRDNFGFDPAFKVSIGDDIADGEKEEELDALNKKDEKKKKFELVKEIRHEIEELDRNEVELAEATRINNLPEEEWFILANNLA